MAFGAADQSNSTKPVFSVASFAGANGVAAELLLQFVAGGTVNDCCGADVDAQPSKSASTYQAIVPVVSVECNVVAIAGAVASGANSAPLAPLIRAQTR